MKIKKEAYPEPHLDSNEWRTWDELANAASLGSHLITSRNGYFHHGIYIGSRRVIHYAGFFKGFHCGPIEEISIEEFSAGKTIHISKIIPSKYSRQEVVKRAASRIGENRYSLLTNNCEHFCNWCLYGESYSAQIRSIFFNPLLMLQLLLQNAPIFLQRSEINI